MKTYLKSGILLFLLFLYACSDKSGPFENPTEEPGENGNKLVSGKVECSNQGIAGVVVTDGFNFTVTDQNGCYSLSPGLTATHIYISSPSGYSVPVENSVPKFYIRLSNVTDRENVNFDLTKLDVSDRSIISLQLEILRFETKKNCRN